MLKKQKNNISICVMDIDGTLTDGKLYYSSQGEFIKAFHVKDGYGIKNILKKYDIIPVIITARKSEMVERRCKELEIKEIHQECSDKYKMLLSILEHYNQNKMLSDQISCANVAYCGDDILDLSCMLPIKTAGGLIGCPADAVSEVKEIANYISSRNGGDGAVRDFIDWLVEDRKAD